MGTTHYLNGKFVTEDELLISPRDLGFTRGYACFDFFRTYNGHKPFMFDLYIDRFFNSAHSIGLAMPWSKAAIKKVVSETLDKNDASKEYAVRIMVSGGPPNPSGLPSDPTLLIILDEAISFPQELYKKGVKLSTLNHQRNLPGSKTTQYIEAIKNAGTLQSEGSHELLYTNNGLILEGAFSNFFCVINDKLVTAASNVLQGITRRVITEKLAIEIPIDMRNLKYEELQSATEAFISVSGKGVVPVVQIDDLQIGNGNVGPITKQVMADFNDYIANGDWLKTT